MDKEQDLKALIREHPHWLIRFGTMGMVLLVLLGLGISTQIQLPHTQQVDLTFESSSTDSEKIRASFEVDATTQLTQNSNLEVHILTLGASEVLHTEIFDITANKAWIELPHEIHSSTQSDISLSCNPKGYATFELGKISVFQKWYNSLFHSFSNN